MPATGGRPILIIGVCRRSGTNFLGSVLLCHRACAAPAPPVAEDQLLRDARLLLRYARRAARRWPRRWGEREEAQEALIGSLGRGLLTFLERRTDGQRVVSRTPYTDHLELVPALYRGADVVVLVRDGRSVAESLMHGWGWSVDEAIREWRRGARAILELRRRCEGVEDPRIHVVRYEDLVAHFDRTVGELLAFTGLDPAGFDAAKAAQLPVVGSSFVRGTDGAVTWDPVERPAGFDPSARFAGWSPRLHRRFAWLAGAEQEALGYSLAVARPGRATDAAAEWAADGAWWTLGIANAGRRRIVAELRTRRDDRRRASRRRRS